MKRKPLYFYPPMFFHWWIRLITLAVWHLRRTIVVRGREHLDTIYPPVIFVSNHTSDWDGPMIRSVFPMFSRWGPMFYVALTRNFYKAKSRHLFSRLFFGGTLFELVGAYPVYLKSGHLRNALMHHIEILNDGGPLVIFPEGKEVREGKVAEFKIGVAYLSAVTGAPCVPVAISGFNKEEVLNNVAHPNVLTISFGKPIYFPKGVVENPESEDLEEFAQDLRNAVCEQLLSHKKV